MSSALFILGISLLAIFAYPLSSDKTQFANQMHLSIHSQLPGFSCKVLIIPGLKSYGNRSFFFGDRNISEEIPIKARRVVTFHSSQKLKTNVEKSTTGKQS